MPVSVYNVGLKYDIILQFMDGYENISTDSVDEGDLFER